MALVSVLLGFRSSRLTLQLLVQPLAVLGWTMLFPESLRCGSSKNYGAETISPANLLQHKHRRVGSPVPATSSLAPAMMCSQS